jgi:hypothetical protein
MVEELCALTVAAPLLFVLLIPRRTLRSPQSDSPLQYLQDRKNATYENLRDLQFDFRTGKLSQADYQASKASLQTELAAILLQMERAGGGQT